MRPRSCGVAALLGGVLILTAAIAGAATPGATESVRTQPTASAEPPKAVGFAGEIEPKNETEAARRQRQAAENALLLKLGLPKAHPHRTGSRHPASVFPLVHEAVRRSLGAPASAERIARTLDRLSREQAVRELLFPFLSQAALEVLAGKRHLGWEQALYTHLQRYVGTAQYKAAVRVYKEREKAKVEWDRRMAASVPPMELPLPVANFQPPPNPLGVEPAGLAAVRRSLGSPEAHAAVATLGFAAPADTVAVLLAALGADVELAAGALAACGLGAIGAAFPPRVAAGFVLFLPLAASGGEGILNVAQPLEFDRALVDAARRPLFTIDLASVAARKEGALALTAYLAKMMIADRARGGEAAAAKPAPVRNGPECHPERSEGSRCGSLRQRDSSLR